MFCYQCEETAKGSSCTIRGVCGKEVPGPVSSRCQGHHHRAETPGLVSPGVPDVLVKNFGIRKNSTVGEDLPRMVPGC